MITQQDNHENPVEPTLSQTFSLYGITAFEVQYWNGSAWTTVPGGSVTGNNKVWRQFTFAPITTSKIRVVVNAGQDNTYSRVVEVEAWNTASAPSSVNLNWLVTDQLGTPRIVLDKTGSLASTKRHDYLPFGEELFANQGLRTPALGYTGDTIRQQFTSKERDNETGLDYFLARYYSSTQGRFTSPDEFSGGPDELFAFAEDASENPTFYAEPSNPQSLNKYQYTYNNPVNLTDEDGHCLPCAAAAAAVLILLSADTTQAPRNTDPSPLPESGDGVKLMVTNAAAGAVAGGVIDDVARPIIRGAVAKIGGSNAAAKAAERTVGADVSPIFKPRGANNPKVAAKLKEGQQRHGELATKVKAKPGWKSEPTLKDPATGKSVKPDVVTKGGRPLEYKPKTPTGKIAGQKQLPKYERATNKKGRVIYYEPRQ